MRWEATLADPDSLADVVDVDTDDLDCEEMVYLAMAVRAAYIKSMAETAGHQR